MRPSDDDFLLTPEARLRELAGILATGILRIRARHVAMPANVETPADDPENSGSARLEVPEKTVLSVHKG
jgi:hypothetical protein